MSIIPKISVGMPKKREKRNLNFDCSTTGNLGTIQPTMCREMVPNEKYSVKVSSLVRLASMPLPTFGRMSLRHHHVFVPIEDLYGAWNALLSGQHYLAAGGSTYVPTKTPYFKMNSKDFIELLLDYCDISIAKTGNLDNPLTITTTNVDWEGNVYPFGDGTHIDPDDDTSREITYREACQAARDADIERCRAAWKKVSYSHTGTNHTLFGSSTTAQVHTTGVAHSDEQDAGGIVNFGDYHFRGTSGDFSAVNFLAYCDRVAADSTPITSQGADFITIADSTGGEQGWSILCRMKPYAKRLRQIFIGLGYQLSPYDGNEYSPFKLVAYYKAWFSLFRPDREMTWVDTNAYKLIKKWDRSSGLSIESNFSSEWIAFLKDLMKDSFYYLPMDYFGMAQLRPQQSMSEAGGTSGQSFKMQPDVMVDSNGQLATGDNANYATQVNNDGAAASSPAVAMVSANGSISPVALKLAQRILRYANKNTVIGRNIREYLKVHYGVSDPNCDQDIEGVIRIGSSRININISDVMSTAENQEGFLGEYAGKGIGYGDSDTFSFSADKFGYWITLTVIVPESGYYQGYLRENRHLTRYDFFMPEFDALGYQVLERGEVIDDFDCDGSTWNPLNGFVRDAAWGFVPRYSEYKVGRNIVNGDLSLPSQYNSMAPYTLDRRISTGLRKSFGVAPNIYTQDGQLIIKGGEIIKVTRPSTVPTLVHDDFRRIDPTDHLGDYNRIFNYTGADLDHFIIHNVFDVRAIAPMMSLSRSFDTYSEEDDSSIDVIKS